MSLFIERLLDSLSIMLVLFVFGGLSIGMIDNVLWWFYTSLTIFVIFILGAWLNWLIIEPIKESRKKKL